MHMQTKIQKWGNSLGVRLPKSITEKKSLKAGMRVEVSESDSKILIEAVPDAPVSLSEMVAGIREDNMHAESNWEAPQGKEVW